MIEYHYINVVLNRIVIFFSTISNRLRCLKWCINIGIKSKFHGLMYFRRLPGSAITIGNNCVFNSAPKSNLIGINRPCMISTLSRSSTILIGDNCGFSGTVIGAFTEIILGNNIKCGANTLITDSNWHPEDPRSGLPKPIEIKDNVWLGVNVVVLKGVTIGNNAVIGANSVVVKDIPANVVASGNPCQVLKKID